MDKVIFISHANVIIDPKVLVPNWSLSEKGQKRHEKLNHQKIIDNIKTIYSSAEQKAIDGAEILAKYLGLNFTTIESLGELDRSSTGYLVEEEFEHTVNDFFENPHISIRGWERAIDAQTRIVNSIKNIIDKVETAGDIAIVSHGGVGALLLTHLQSQSISRKFDQPNNGGGNYFCFYKKTFEVIHDWIDISK